MAHAIVFWILAIVGVGAALAVVLVSNVFRAALFLVLCFFIVAVLFATLGADYLAAVQVLVYVGAIAVLLLLAIMLTREHQRGSPFGRLRWPAAIVGALLLAIIVMAVTTTPWPVAELAAPKPTTEDIAKSLFSMDKGFVLPFEIASVLLLAAVIGAIAIVRER